MTDTAGAGHWVPGQGAPSPVQWPGRRQSFALGRRQLCALWEQRSEGQAAPLTGTTQTACPGKEGSTGLQPLGSHRGGVPHGCWRIPHGYGNSSQRCRSRIAELVQGCPWSRMMAALQGCWVQPQPWGDRQPLDLTLFGSVNTRGRQEGMGGSWASFLRKLSTLSVIRC